MLDNLTLENLLSPKVSVPFAIYLITFTGFALYFLYWIEERIKHDERQPHPLIVNGVLIKESVTCNPGSEDFETMDPSIRTIADICKYVFFSWLFILAYFHHMERKKLYIMESNGFHIHQ